MPGKGSLQPGLMLTEPERPTTDIYHPQGGAPAPSPPILESPTRSFLSAAVIDDCPGIGPVDLDVKDGSRLKPGYRELRYNQRQQEIIGGGAFGLYRQAKF